MWPAHFPADCPPSTAEELRLDVFRLVRNAPATRQDFQPTNIEFPHRSFPAEKLCQACGVSVYQDLIDIREVREFFKGLRGRSIASGTILPGDGPVFVTGPRSHTTWWLRTEMPEARFSHIVSEEVAR